MFGRSPPPQMKAVEEALRQRRLDQAFNLAVAGGLLGQRGARSLLEEIGGGLLHRGQDRLLERRFREAQADFDNAARCGLPPGRVADWQRRAREALDSAVQQKAERDAALADVRRRMSEGSLAGADEALHRLPTDDPERRGLSDAINNRRDEAARALSSAQHAAAEGSLAQAARQIEHARGLDRNLAGLAELEMQIVSSVTERAAEDFRQGRLAQSAKELALLGELGRSRRERTELEEALRLAREAAEALSADRYARASVLLGRLAQGGTNAKWIIDAREHLEKLESHRRSLMEGPLGLVGGGDLSKKLNERTLAGDETLPAAAPMAPAPPVVPAEAHLAEAAGHLLPRRLLLRIDGVGSFLLLRGSRIGIGRSGAGSTADLPLVSDLSDRQAEIVRAGEDYFIVSEGGVDLGGRNVDHALLQDGDRIRLSPRIRLKFRRPSLKSSTAALDLGEGVRTTTDCRRVLLWEGPILMGSARECHVQLDSRAGDFLLIERGGKLYVKPTGPGGATTPVVLGEQTAIGELRFSVADWSRA